MQKVEGSSPFSRFSQSPAQAGLCRLRPMSRGRQVRSMVAKWLRLRSHTSVKRFLTQYRQGERPSWLSDRGAGGAGRRRARRDIDLIRRPVRGSPSVPAEERSMSRSRRASVVLATAALGAIALVAAPGSDAAKAPPAPAPVYPNVVEEIPSHLGIQNDHQREWLRFSTTHINLGPGNLQIRGGGQIAPCTIDGVAYDQCTVATQEVLDANGKVALTHPAGVAFFHPEHNHWHQSGVAEFKLMRDNPVTGTQLAAGVKITFCFVDVEFTGLVGADKKAQPRTYWECNGDLQGLAAGWGDEYHQSTPLQELEVTGLPEGDYYLTHEADPDNHWLEGPSATSPGELDNFTWVKFHLDRMTGANPSVTVVDHSPCSGVVCGYGGNP